MTVFLWNIIVTFKRDVKIDGMNLASLVPGNEKMFTLRSSNNEVISAIWEKEQKSINRKLQKPLNTVF